MKTPSTFFRLCAFALALLLTPAMPTLHAQTKAQPTCQGTTVLTAPSGTISDRTITGTKSQQPTMDCFWLIQPAGTVTGSTITLDFQSFDAKNLTFSEDIRVYDGADINARLLGSFSNRNINIPARIYSTGKTLLVRFTTDRFFATRGWSIQYRTQPEVLTAPFQWFGATDYYSRGLRQLSYQNNDRRSWLIRPPGARRIALRFGEFDTEAGADEVRVYDGTDTTARLLGRFSGSSAATAPIFSSGGAMVVTFSSNQSNVRSGWNAYYVAERDSVFLDVQKESVSVQEVVVAPTALGDSSVQQYQIIASNVKENLVLETVSAGYRLSRSPQGVFTQTLTIEPDRNGLIPYTGIFVQASPTVKGNLNGSITHRIGNSVKTITLRTVGYTFRYWEPTGGPNLLFLNGFTNIGNTIFIGTAVGIYQTISNGSIWQPIAFIGQRIEKLTAIDTLLFAFLDRGIIYRSLDKGKSWEKVSEWDYNSLAFKDTGMFEVRQDSSRTGYGLFRSKDGGKTWALVLTMKDYQSQSFFISPDKVLRVGVESDRFLRSTDNGATWDEDKEFSARPNRRIIAGKCVFEVFVSSSNNNGTSILDSLRRTSDNGKTWVRIGKNLPDSVNLLLDFHALQEGKVLLVSTFYGLFVSQDSGEIFQKINHTIGQTTGEFQAFSKDRDLYCEVNGLLYRSTNLGLNWSLVMNGISGAPTRSIVAARQTLYSDTYFGFFRSSNAGESWQRINVPSDIRVYNDNSNLIAVQGDLFVCDKDILSRLRSGSSDWEKFPVPRITVNDALQTFFGAPTLDVLSYFTDGKDLFYIFYSFIWGNPMLKPVYKIYHIWKFDINNGKWNEQWKVGTFELLSSSAPIVVNRNKLFLPYKYIGINSYGERLEELYYQSVRLTGKDTLSSDYIGFDLRLLDSGNYDTVNYIVRNDTSLYVATSHDVLRSLDNGETWSPTGLRYSPHQLCSSEYGVIALTTDGVYIFDEGVWRKNNEGLPKNTRPTMVTAIDNYMYAVFPSSLYQVVHRARIDAPSTVARAELTIPDTLTAFAGEEIDIPIKVSAAKRFFGDSATVALTLRFNASVLQPITSFRPGAPQISTEDGQTLVRMSFKVRELRETVITLRCRVMLGNSVATPIFMTNINSNTASVVATGPGIFTLKQFSEVGGTRSFRSAEAAVTLVALPNPVQDVVAVKYFVVEEGTTTITVVDMMGRTIKTLESGTMHQGWQTKTFPVTDLPSGTYFLMLQTPSALKVQRMEVIR